MDEVIIDGKKYISSKRAAQFARYTADYIGQLCRSEKIDAKRVGRNWYVSEDAIFEHKREYHPDAHISHSAHASGSGYTPNTRISEIPHNADISRQDEMQDGKQNPAEDEMLEREKEEARIPTFSYTRDDSPLYPELEKDPLENDPENVDAVVSAPHSPEEQAEYPAASLSDNDEDGEDEAAGEIAIHRTSDTGYSIDGVSDISEITDDTGGDIDEFYDDEEAYQDEVPEEVREHRKGGLLAPVSITTAFLVLIVGVVFAESRIEYSTIDATRREITTETALSSGALAFDKAKELSCGALAFPWCE